MNILKEATQTYKTQNVKMHLALPAVFSMTTYMRCETEDAHHIKTPWSEQWVNR